MTVGPFNRFVFGLFVFHVNAINMLIRGSQNAGPWLATVLPVLREAIRREAAMLRRSAYAMHFDFFDCAAVSFRPA
jgi:hypothetical protein